jgi:hypothetical protein
MVVKGVYLNRLSTGGKDAKLPEACLEIRDTTGARKICEIEIDSDDVEAMAFDLVNPPSSVSWMLIQERWSRALPRHKMRFPF